MFQRDSCVPAGTVLNQICRFALTAALGVTCVGMAADSPTIDSFASDIRAIHSNGQTFITWTETGSRDVAYGIYRSDQPITLDNLDSAELLDHVPWGNGKCHATAAGFVIPSDDHPLDASTGLYVVTPSQAGRRYYAVTTVQVRYYELAETLGLCSLDTPVDEVCAEPQPILQKTVEDGAGKGFYYIVWLGSVDPTGKFPKYGYASKLSSPFAFRVCPPDSYDGSRAYPLILVLHSGVTSWGSYGAVFGDRIALIPDDHLHTGPTGNNWTFTLWYGYNSNFQTSRPIEEGVMVNYTERRLLYALDWLTNRSPFKVDTNRVCCWGSSVGGIGALNFGVRHPEIFAMVDAQFANIDQRNNTWFRWKIEEMAGRESLGLKTNEGVNVWDRLNLNWYLRHSHEDTPFIRLWSGKNDKIIRWQARHIPSTFVEFCNVINETRHGGLFVWTQAKSYLGHGEQSPAEVLPEWQEEAIWEESRYRFRKDQSYPAFSSSSLNDDPGNGDPKDGARIGGINRFLLWGFDNIRDEEGEYEITLFIHDSAPHETASVDVTPRRLQEFRLAPHDKCAWRLRNLETSDLVSEGVSRADEHGLLTIEKLTLSKVKRRLSIYRKD